ncbi:MAG: hypothetical protein JNG90_03440, partial [Planctomycetaceae bacterium]|nr:hypothetical protein [Planctomycetaceae bacterium]
MCARILWTALAGLLFIAPLDARAQPPRPAPRGDQWRAVEKTARGEAAPPAPLKDDGIAPVDQQPPARRAPARSESRGKAGLGSLPNQQGQVYREYDISRYTMRVTSTQRPEQAIVDWILRDTGYEAWHSETVAILSADSRMLRVYHTPEVQDAVADIVDRFVSSEAESHAFGLRIIGLGSPNWRAKATAMMRPVPVQSQGVQAWLVAKEDATFLLAELRKRSDFREHSSPHLLVNNGQPTVVAATRPRPYQKEVHLRPGTFPGFEAEMSQIDEGFSLELSPLLSLDGRLIDATLKCKIEQVEKIVPVPLDVPVQGGQRQRTRVDVPQTSQFEVNERFRWPADHVLVIGLGVVAVPVPSEPSMRLGLSLGPARSDLVLFVESKGKPSQVSTAAKT